jgi:hypothetical protein
MANGNNDPRIYEALALPAQALDNGGVEILRVGIVDDELYVTARPAFRDPGKWGEVLAEIADRLGAIYAAENLGPSVADVTVDIAEAFAAEMGAKPLNAAAKPRTKKSAKKKKAAKKRLARRKKR